jgi:YesN/AraC family two-component response regulator
MINKPTILIVKDELLIARDIKNILEEEEYNVIGIVDSVERAIESIEKQKPDLVLIDINLNKSRDGIDLGMFLLSNDAIPFIYLTGISDKLTINRASDSRPHGYIIKPFRAIDLKTTAAIVLNNYNHKNIDVLRKENIFDDEVPFFLKEIINHINDNITEKLEVKQLAQMTKWKSQYFQRLFTKYMSVTPYQYILNKKIEKTKALLVETDIRTRQISFEMGFASHSNFCYNFKKITGETPQEHRKIHKVKKHLQQLPKKNANRAI